MVEGAIHSGEELILIQEGFRLHVKNLEWFNSAAGASAYLTVRVIEVLEGKLPSHLEELILNANGWEIYRADDPSIPPLPEGSTYDELIEALQIFKAADPEDQWIDARHDVLHGGPESIDRLSPGQLKRLEELGWHPDSSGSGFYFYT